MNDNGITNKYLEEVVRVVANTEMVDIAKALLAEREEREKMQDVWKDAPNEATLMKVDYVGANFYLQKDYTRTLPKTRAREIAEELALDLGICNNHEAIKYAADKIEPVLINYRNDK